MLDVYHSEFTTHAESANKLLDELASIEGDAETKSKHSQTIAEEIKEMKDCLSSIQKEVQSLPAQERSNWNDELQSCKRTFDLIKKRSLLSSSGLNSSSVEAFSRVPSRLADGNEMLDESRRIAAASEEYGEDILKNLYTQRETMENSKKNMKVIHGNLSQSGGVVNRMSKWWRRFI